VLSFVLPKVAVLSRDVHSWCVDEKNRFADRMIERKVGSFRVKVAHFAKKPVCFSRKGVADFGGHGSLDLTAKGECSAPSPSRAYASGVFPFFAFTSSPNEGKLLSISE
jgi:hypothetical protein